MKFEKVLTESSVMSGAPRKDLLPITGATTVEVHLVQISPSVVVPFSSRDFGILVEHGLTTSRIPLASLGLLKTTLLRNVAVKISPISEMQASLIGQFDNALKALPSARTQLRDDGSLLLLYAFGSRGLDLSVSEEELAAQQAKLADFEAQLDRTCAYMRKYLGMYCRLLTREVKDKPESGVRLYRFTVREAEYMDNAMYYSLKVDKPTVASLNLGPAFRLKFEFDALQVKQIIRTTSEDLCGGEWQGALTRAFQIGSIDQKSVVEVVNFLLSHCYRSQG